jgi:hypothetical protein
MELEDFFWVIVKTSFDIIDSKFTVGHGSEKKRKRISNANGGIW